jgi:hypothetical protein
LSTDEPATQEEAIEALLERSGRDHVPIRRSFLQRRDRVGGGAGPLSEIVRTRRSVALDLYLLLHALASTEPYDVSLGTAVWARLTGLQGSSGSSRIQRSWRWLADQRLIDLSESGRPRRITLLREDASGDTYAHPGTGAGDAAAEGDYFKLPYVYWRGHFYGRLGLSGKSVLLIALSLQPDFILPGQQAAGWYGLSPDTIKRGIRQLRSVGVLSVRMVSKKAPLAPAGHTLERHYSLRAPFSVS